MSSSGVADKEIIARLKQSRAVYPLSGSEIAELGRQGVSPTVLDYLQDIYVDSVRRRERMMYGDAFWGYPCPSCRYPYWRVPPYHFPY